MNIMFVNAINTRRNTVRQTSENSTVKQSSRSKLMKAAKL